MMNFDPPPDLALARPAIVRPAEHALLRPGAFRPVGREERRAIIDDLVRTRRMTANEANRAMLFVPVVGWKGSPDTDPHFAAVKLLAHFDGEDGSTTFTDSSAAGHTLSRSGNAQLDTSQAKFGGSSLYLDGSGDAVTSPSHSDWSLGTGDFTIEFWVRHSSTAGPQYYCAAGTGGGVAILFYNDSLILARRGQADDLSHTWNPTHNIWHHIAVSRISAIGYIFVDGNLVQSGNVTSNYGQGALIVGGYSVDAGELHGWVDEFRWTKGVGRYLSSFPPPVARFPDV